MYQSNYYQPANQQYGFGNFEAEPIYWGMNYGNTYDEYGYYKPTSGSSFQDINYGYPSSFIDYPSRKSKGTYSYQGYSYVQPTKFVDEGYTKNISKSVSSKLKKSSSSKKKKTTTTATTTTAPIKSPKLKPVVIPNSDSNASLYSKSYVVTPRETERIRKFFDKHTMINLSEFKKLSADICPQDGIDEIAEEHFLEFDADQDGKLNFDDFLVAYAFVRYRKYGGADYYN